MMNESTYNTEFFEFEEYEDLNTVQSSSKLENDDTTFQENMDDESIPSEAQLGVDVAAAVKIAADGEKEEKENEPLWSIDDDTLFYPLGLLNHGTGVERSVFVTWCEDYVLNFVFKTSKKTNATKMTKVRLAVPVTPNEERMETDEYEDYEDTEFVIKEIHILEFNTLLLMRSGHVCYFSSMKSMHPVPWLRGVRCISKATAQAGFSVIRLDEARNLLYLEVYRDVKNLGRNPPELLKRYDVTFDEENLFNCQWQDERFTLYTQAVTEQNLTFLQHLTFGVDYELNSVKQELHLFTISGHVFVLIADTNAESITPDYHIQLLFTHASNVEFIKILCERQMCLIFLQCGTIEIWFVSNVTETLERHIYYTGTQYTHYEFSPANNCFYYTDERKVAQLEFSYESAADLVLVEEHFKPISDMLACTWVDSIKRLICLSANNIFYQISFESPTPNEDQPTTNFESMAQLYELTPAKIAQLVEKSHVVNELSQVPVRLNNATEQEFSKQQLIAIGQKQRTYKKVLQATLRFCISPPCSFVSETVLLHTNLKCTLQSDSLFAMLELTVKKKSTLHATHWNLLVNHNETSHVFSMPATLLLEKKICVLVPLTRKTQAMLPVFKLSLVGFVQHNADFLAIVLPIPVHINEATYVELFSSTRHALSMCSEMSIAELVEKFTKANIKSNCIHTQTPKEAPQPAILAIAIPQQCKFEQIAQIFKAIISKDKPDAADLIDIDEEPTTLRVYFMQSSVKLTFSAEKCCLSLESADTGALYYARLHLILNFLPLGMKVNDGMNFLEELREQYIVKC